MSLFTPSTWPLAVKLSLTLLLVSLLPMSVVGIYNLRQSLRTVEESTYENLELLASGTSDRMDQLINDTRQSTAEVAGDAEVGEFIAKDPTAREAFDATVRQTLENIVRSNTDIASVMLLNDTGFCLASTNHDNIGQTYAFRDYFQAMLAGDSFTSELLSGSTTHQAGVYFSHRIANESGRMVGVAVLKLKSEALDAITRSIHAEGKRDVLLIDPFGVVISASDSSTLYRSLMPLAAEVEARPAFRDRFTSIGIHHVESLGFEELGQAVTATSPAKHGRASYVTHGTRRIAGIARMKTREWTVIVDEPAAIFVEPTAALEKKERISSGFIGLLVTILAVLLARSIVRPVKQITAAAGAVARGHFDVARVDVRRRDELGELAEAFNTMAHGLRERERERDMFGRVVSPEVREKLLGGELHLGGETLWVSVLFSDIRGFSTISEKMDPQAVVALLNEYMTEMAEAVRPFHGYVNNFIGDAIVVVFGAPISRPHVEQLAVSAALAMREHLERLNDRRRARGEEPLATGIGISAGEVVAGNIGSLERMLYTVIGDAVNVASRLETLTKEYPGRSILVTGRVAAELGSKAEGAPACAVERIGPVIVKGRVDPVDVYAVGPAIAETQEGA
jgi:adenylate cyclase